MPLTAASFPNLYCTVFPSRLSAITSANIYACCEFVFLKYLCRMTIRIFITGGTFDKEYNEINGQLYFKDTHMQELLEMGRNKVAVEIRTLMMIDSLEMTAEDRGLIVHQCKNAEEDRIVITHGTDTMAETAAVLG